jgi:transmembrane sensor
MDNNQPTSSKDEALRKAFGEYLDADRTLDSVDDPLLKALLPLKTDYKYEEEQSYQKEQLWDNIERKLDHTNSQKVVAKIWPIRHAKSLLASAALISIIGLFLMKWLGTNTNDLPTYLSSSTVQNIVLADGTKVQLRPYSSLTKVQTEKGTVRYFLEGEAYFDVTKDDNRLFEVQTAVGTIQVLGTQFNLSYRNQQMTVYLKEGLVSVENSAQTKAINLKPTQAATVDSLGSIVLEETANEKVYLDWLSASLYFSDMPLSSIIPELEQHFSINIVIPLSVAQTKVSGSIALTSVEESLGYLGTILGGRFEKQQLGSYTFILNE